MRSILLLIFVSLIASSCAHVISQDALRNARTDVPFSEVARDPFFYDGSLFVWGGVIVETRLTDTGSVVEVVQTPLNRFGAVSDEDVSEGRFLVRSNRHLDPLIYEEGRQITVAGVLVGSTKRHLGDTEYLYPILEVRELYLWKEEPAYPPYYYDPWYYDPWYYDPWYYGSRHRYPYWRHH